jgi:hypothetical protein
MAELTQDQKVEVSVSLLREYFNQMAGIITDIQSGDIPMEDGMQAMDDIERHWAEKLVEGISPAPSIIKLA